MTTAKDFQSDYNWQELFKRHVTGYTLSQVSKVLASNDGENDERDWLALLEMKDDKFMYVYGGCDYTGWGCQDWGTFSTYSTKKAAIQAMGDDHRHRLGLKMVY